MPTENLAAGFFRRETLALCRGKAHENAGRTETALQSMTVTESFLKAAEFGGRSQRLNRFHCGAVDLRRQGEARSHGFPVDQNRACTAHAVLAADVRSRESLFVAQPVR